MAATRPWSDHGQVAVLRRRTKIRRQLAYFSPAIAKAPVPEIGSAGLTSGLRRPVMTISSGISVPVCATNDAIFILVMLISANLAAHCDLIAP